LKAAKKFGADVVINAKEDVPAILREVNENRPADRVIICTGALPAVHQAWQCVDRGGTILFFAVPPPDVKVTIPITDFWRNETTVTTSYGASPMDLAEALEIISAHKINVRDMITHRLSLEEAGLGFRIVAEAKECIKVIIEPHR
ncbi:MAG: zinc-binding dehydrogenase, partial [Candidatus Baldrarchaeia archaeon]